MERENNKLKFTLIWSSCICVLLLMVVLGISSSAKGTLAAETTYTCDGVGGNLSGNQCIKTLEFGNALPLTESSICGSSTYGYGSGWSGTCTRTDNGDDNDPDTPRYSYSCTCTHAAVVNSEDGDDEGYVDADGNCTNATSCPANQYLTTDDDGCKKCVSCPSERPYSRAGATSDTACVVSFCQECNGTSGTFWWNNGVIPEPTCNGGWHSRSDITIQANCKTKSSSSSSTSNPKYIVKFTDGDDVETIICTDIDDTKTCAISKHVGQTWYVDRECTTSIVVKSYVTGDTNYYRCKSAPTTSPDDDKKEPTSPSNSSSSSSSGGSSSSEPSVSDPSDEEISSKPDDDNVSSNPQTGDIAIFVVWVIAAAAIVYSVWYFKKVREN